MCQLLTHEIPEIHIHLDRDTAMGQGMRPPHIWLCVPSPTKCTGCPKLTQNTWQKKAKNGEWGRLVDSAITQQKALCHPWKWLPLTTQPAFIGGFELDHGLGGGGENCTLVNEPSYWWVLRCLGKEVAVWP